MKALSFAIAFIVITASTISLARPDRARNRHQSARIKQGVVSGQLTKEEAKDLRQEKRDINEKRREYKSDGAYTKEERTDVKSDRNELSKDIYEEKHDNQVRPRVNN